MRRALVLISGLPATGKTTVADGLARRLDSVTFSRDWAREEVVGPIRSRLDRSLDPLYARLNMGHRPRAQRLANVVLLEVLKRQLHYDRPTIVEVVADPVLRDALARVASDADARFLQIECTCTDRATWTERLLKRGDNWLAAADRVERRYAAATNPVAVLDSATEPPHAVVEMAYRLVTKGSSSGHD